MSRYNIKNNKGESIADDNKVNWWLIPLILVVAVVPVIMRLAIKETHYPYYPWYSGTSKYVDFALVWKGYAIGVVGGIMALCNIYLFAKLDKTGKAGYLKRYWPVLAYIVLVVLSSLFAISKTAAYNGEYGQSEPLYVLLGYGMIALNISLVVKGKKDLKAVLIAFFAGIFIVSLYGVLQACNIEPLEWNVSKYLIMSSAQRSKGQIQMTFEKGRVISTLFNPNYMGPYVALVLPVCLTYLCVAKKLWKKLIAAVLSVFLLVCLVFSQSKTGVIICAFVFFLMIVIAFRNWAGILVKRWFGVIVFILIIVTACNLFNLYFPEVTPKRILNALTIKEDGYALKGIDTTGDCVKVLYKNSTLEFRFDEDNYDFVVNIVENGKALEPLVLNGYNEYTSSFATCDGDVITAKLFTYSRGCNGVTFTIDGKEISFTNQVKSGDYQIVNSFDRLDESVILGGIFKNHKKFASGRGYSWSRFLPVSLKYLFIGAGPDNFPFAVNGAGDDYAYKINANLETTLFSRPHNFFIQMWVNTGFLSLLMFLIFAGRYIVDCFKLYFNKKLTEGFEYIGLACMAGVIGFLGNGIANDSLTCLTPLYWAVLGCGIVVNEIIKNSRKA